MDESDTWLKEIEPAIVEHLSDKEVNSAPPSFPFEEFSKKIKATFQTDALEISVGSCEWKSHETLLSGLGKNPISLPLELSPLEGSLFWVMASEDIEKALSWMKFGEGDPIELGNQDLLKGLYRYTALEIVDIVWSLKVYPDLSLKLTENVGFDPTAYSIDIAIKNGEDVVWGRLIVSKTFKHSFENHFAIKKVTLTNLKNTLGNFSLPISFNVGNVELTQDELKNLKEGDFIVPDALHYDPKIERGNIRVMLGEKALFVAKPKDDHIKLMDSIYAYQETTNG